jgi:hypothetical protein
LALAADGAGDVVAADGFSLLAEVVEDAIDEDSGSPAVSGRAAAAVVAGGVERPCDLVRVRIAMELKLGGPRPRKMTRAVLVGDDPDEAAGAAMQLRDGF